MNTRLGLALLFALAFCFAIGSAASAQQTTSLSDSQMPSVITIPAEAQPSDSFSAEAATNAYLAQISAAARARSDAYFEGGYWLILCDFLLAVIVYWALLRLGWSARMTRFAEHLTGVRVLQNFFYWIQFMLITFVLTFPLTVYEGFFREWKYGLATQTFGPWMGDQIKGLLIAIILGGIVAVVLLQIVRWLPNTWHIWGAIVTTLFMIAAIMIAPVYLLPLFNKVTKLDDPKVTQPILSMAGANGIPAHDVFEVDASRQTTRMSANVSGFGKTMRITLNDNLLRRGSPEEIQSVMGHEMGHYVLHHIYKDVLFLFVVTVAFFALLRWGLRYSLARWGTKWGVQGIADPAVIPLVFLIATIFFFVLTPVSNTQTRTEEAEADMFGLNASRQPDGFVQAAIHLGEYRKMSPGSVEEWIFFDHPSGRNRIYRAMRWKAENLQLFQPSQKP
jgi:STE24 endopeptidase